MLAGQGCNQNEEKRRGDKGGQRSKIKNVI